MIFKINFSSQKQVVHYSRYDTETSKLTLFLGLTLPNFDPKCLHIAYT